MSGNAILHEKHRKTLNQFRSVVSDILKPHHDDDFLLRWLKARDFEVAKAEKMIRKSFKFMHNLEAENILNCGFELQEVVETYLPMRFWGCDKEGSPVRLFVIGKTDLRGFSQSVTIFDALRSLAYVMESDLKRAKENGEKTGKFSPEMVYIADYRGFEFRQLLDKRVFTLLKTMTIMYQDNYPELLKAVYIINVPPLFPAALALFKPFINENTLNKFRIFASDEWQNILLERIGRSIVPRYYGGDMDEPYHDPDVFLGTMETIPVTYYVKDHSYLKPTDPGTTVIVIQPQHTYSYTISVKKIATILKWVFQIRDYNIKFGVMFQTTKDNEYKDAPKVLIKSEFVDPQYVPERGELRCEKIGEYILHFDNTQSWLVKKELLLRVDIKEPEEELISEHR